MNGIIDSMYVNLSKLREIVKDKETCVLQSTGLQRVRYNCMTEQQQSRHWNIVSKLLRKHKDPDPVADQKSAVNCGG